MDVGVLNSVIFNGSERVLKWKSVFGENSILGSIEGRLEELFGTRLSGII